MLITLYFLCYNELIWFFPKTKLKQTYIIVQTQVIVPTEHFVLLDEKRTEKVMYKSASKECGDTSAVMNGMMKKQKLFANNWSIHKQVKEHDRFFFHNQLFVNNCYAIVLSYTF